MIFKRRKSLIKRLLIVEDEPLVAFDNEYFLKSAGYDVQATVDSVEAAIEALDGTTDLVVLDVNISGDGDGVDVAKAARDLGVPVLFVTGACPNHAKSLGLGCLSKPYRDRDLTASIKALDRVIAGEKPGSTPGGLALFDESIAAFCAQ